MVRNVDHVTVAVRDAAAGLSFFCLLGFREEKSVVIAGSPFDAYMGVPGIEAEHRTLVLENFHPRFEIQLLTYRKPAVRADSGAGDLARTGFNHICFAVDDLDAEVARPHGRRREAAQPGHAVPRPQAGASGRAGGLVVELAQWA